MKKFLQIIMACGLLATVPNVTTAQAQKIPITSSVLSQQWTLQSVNGQPVKDMKVKMSFDAKKNQVSINACNNFTGSYIINERATILQFVRMAGTMKWCADDNIQDLEKLLTTLFAKNYAHYDVYGNAMTLSDMSGNVYIWINDAQDRLQKYMENYSWKLVQMNGLTGVYDQTIEFDFKENRVYGHAGCNNYFATLDIYSDRFNPGPLGVTRKACVDAVQNRDETKFLELMNQEDLYFDVADQVLNVYKDGEIILMFNRHGAPKIYE